MDEFFAFARARHMIYLDRAAGKPRPWTTDPILHNYKFTNVFRELDKTTDWFRFNVREPMRKEPEVLLATVIFRWFNRILSGEAIFCQRMINRMTPFDHYLKHGDVAVFKTALKAYCGDGPYFTGAYMIRSPNGLNKLDGMLKCIDKFNNDKQTQYLEGISTWRSVAEYNLGWPKKQSLRLMWQWLKEYECQGPFHAYEVVTDLRHTKLLSSASDIMTWANAGPGCKRGVGRFNGLGLRQAKSGRMKQQGVGQEDCISVMNDILQASKQKEHWPTSWPSWEMREVEHTLCEWDKYERLKWGQGKVKGRYQP